MATSFKLDRCRQVAPQIYEMIREKIVSLEYAPGEALSRNAMAAQFNVSQTPVREALLRLAEEALVDTFPQASTRVSLIDMEFAEEAHFLRRAIELELVREAALHPQTELITGLRTLMAHQEAACERQDYQSFTLLDHEFHHAIYAAVGRGDLWRLVHCRSGHIDRLRRLHLPTDNHKMTHILDDHHLLVDAIAASDALAAQQVLRHHLSGTLEFASSIRAAYPHYFTPA